MFNRKKITLLTAAMTMALLGSGCGGKDKNDDDNNGVHTGSFVKPANYAGFPITLLDADAGGATTSVSYKGQMARHVLREGLKEIARTSDATATEAEILAKINDYLINANKQIDDVTINAPKTKGEFIIKETKVNELSTGKSLRGTIYDGTADHADAIPGVSANDKNIAMGVPGHKSAQEVVDLWAVNLARNIKAGNGHVDMEFGYDYRQLLPKYLMGAAFYNQAVDKYLDEYIKTKKPHNLPYKDGKYYTGAEHSWDEGFGYFGAAANFGVLTASQNKKVKKQDETVFADADHNGDNKVSLYTEYTSGPAYYAASFDTDAKSTYGKNIMNAWLTGRTLIANAIKESGQARALTESEMTTLLGHAKTVQSNWEMVFAEAVYKYVGGAHKQITQLEQDPGNSSLLEEYFAQWSEAKGFMLGLQFGGSESKINKANFEIIDNLIGFGPVLEDGSQVNGVSGNTFSKSAADASAFGAYKAKLKSVQTKLDALYTLKVKKNPIS